MHYFIISVERQDTWTAPGKQGGRVSTTLTAVRTFSARDADSRRVRRYRTGDAGGGIPDSDAEGRQAATILQ
jgi:hypothetical protein